MKRKMNIRGKKQNLSIHQFDETLQKTIQDTVEKERLEIENQNTKQAQTVKLDNQESKSIDTNMLVVDNHVKPKDADPVEVNEFDDDQDQLNDREIVADVDPLQSEPDL